MVVGVVVAMMLLSKLDSLDLPGLPDWFGGPRATLRRAVG
jgi:hypothetical protein